jgi:hypothetical protein
MTEFCLWIVASAVAVPANYMYDILVRDLHFSAFSILGAAVVFVAFALLNLHEYRTKRPGAEIDRKLTGSLQEGLLRGPGAE